LPDPNRQRRNAPLIPTTNLPAAGRQGPPPRVPDGYKLNHHGRRFWKWAWSTPQAAAWDEGCVYLVARRAQLEGERTTLRAAVPKLSVDEIIEAGALLDLARTIAGAAATVDREIRELDDRLGLNPKARAALRWQITAGDEPSEESPADEVARRRAERQARRAASE
jgi:hypothetical protein